MDKIQKFLLRLTPKERSILLEIIQKIYALQLEGLDVKALTGSKNMFRLRKGKFRIIFEKVGSTGNIIDMNYRGNIYK